MLDREEGGKLVRDTWVEWALTQSHTKVSWLIPWHLLPERDKEADRCIWDAIAAYFMTQQEELYSILTDLIKESPIVYDDYDTKYRCEVCYATTRAIWDPPGHLRVCDEDTFPHNDSCPILRAKRVLASLGEQKEAREDQ